MDSQKADKFSTSLKNNNRELYNKLNKLKQNTEAGKNKARLADANKKAKQYAKEKTKTKGEISVLTETIKAIDNEKDNDREK